MTRWSLIESAATDGARNMAVDEALLDSCIEGGEWPPALRLYSFTPPCLSLGAFQPWRASIDPDFCRSHGIEIVRRPTGGRAVLHHVEVTYAVVARLGQPPFGTRVRQNYDAISAALLEAFAALGVRAAVGGGESAGRRPAGSAACFADPSDHEIASGEWKLAGSAQVRRRGAFLQHGSLPLAIDAELLAGAVTPGLAEGAEGAAIDPRGLSQVAGREIASADLRAALVEGFRSALGAGMESRSLTPRESARAEWLRAHKYLTAAWTLRR